MKSRNKAKHRDVFSVPPANPKKLRVLAAVYSGLINFYFDPLRKLVMVLVNGSLRPNAEAAGVGNEGSKPKADVVE